MFDFMRNGYFDFVFNVGIGLFLIFFSYHVESYTKAKGKPVPFLKMRFLRILGWIMLVGTLLWGLVERFLLKSH